jgi:hypothetical protein
MKRIPLPPIVIPGTDGFSVEVWRQTYHTGPIRWRCKQCGRERRSDKCLHCGTTQPITNERRVPGVIS